MSGGSKRMNPFPGLRAFQADEDYLFFGREEQTLELLQRLASHRFVAVVGTSGSGKSSLVRCGLLSELLGGKMLQAGAAWEVAVTHPGGNPLAILTDALLDADLYDRDEENARENLLATLSRSHFGLVEAVKQAGFGPETNFLLVVDQFEEIFRFHEAGQTQQEAANEFVSILLEAVAQKEVPIYVVLTMRSDFIGECGQFEGLAEMVNRGEFLIPRLTREQYKRVIEGPIKVAGGQITPRLLQRLLNDLGQQADQLPCLQHALMRTWSVWSERGETDALDLDDYQCVGKMTQALSLHADEVYASLASDRQRELCRGIFQALTVQESENRGIRRPQRLNALCQILEVQPDELIPIIDAYRQHGVTFLMPAPEVELTDQTIIDISHESLMRVWTRLRQWVEEEAQAAGIYRRLSESADLYEQGKAGLYRDPELGIALAWREAQRPNQAWARRYHRGFSAAIKFLEASQQAQHAERQECEAARERELEQARQLAEAQRLRLEQQQRAARRLRGMLGGLAVVAVIAGVACVAALVQNNKANRLAEIASQEAENARDSAAEADRQRQTAEDAQRETQRLLGRVEESLATTEQAEEAAREQAAVAVRAREEADRQRLLARRSLYSSTLFTAQRSIESPGATSRHEELLADLRPQAGETDLRDWEWYYLWSQSDESRLVLRGHTGGVNSASYSPDGQRLLTAADDGTIRIRDARTGAELQTLVGHTGAIWDANWSNDGRWIVSGGSDSVIRIWDAETGFEVRTLTGHSKTVYSVVFSSDSTKIASGAADNSVRVWGCDTGEELLNLSGHSEAVWGVAWSPDGLQLASCSSDHTVRIWNPETGELIRTLSGHTYDVYGLAWSHNGSQLASGGRDASQTGIRIWDVATGEEVRTLKGHVNSVFRLAWSTDDSLLASGALDNTARVWDMQTGQQLRLFGDNSNWVMDVEFSADGSQLLTAVNDGTASIRDVERYEGLRFPVETGLVYSIVWSPDGRLIAAPAENNSVTIFDVATQATVMTFRGHTARPLTVDWAPDGSRLVSSGSDRIVRVWDAESGEEIWNAPGSADGDVNRVAWSPVGTRIASAGDDDTVRIFDAETGEQLHTLRADDQDRYRLTLAWSPDGTLIASEGVTEDDTDSEVVVVWNAETGEVVRTLPHRGASWRTVAFSPDGRRLAAGGWSVSEDTFGGSAESSRGLFTVWDLETEQELFSRDAHQLQVSTVEWNHEGSRLLSAGTDGALRIWGAETGQELLSLEDSAANGLYSARFSPDGVQIAAAAGGEAIRVWDATPGYARELSPNLLPILTAHIDADPQYDDLKLRGEILAGRGEWEQAAADFERAAEVHPPSALADASPWFTSPWWVVGPYPEVLDAQQSPETSLDPLAAVRAAMSDDDTSEPLAWESIILGENQGLDLGRFFHEAEHISGYAQVRVFSPTEQSAGILLGADDTVRVWLNGELVHDRTEARTAVRDDEALEVRLQPGWNTLLTKVSNSTQNHGLFLRLSDDPAELARVFERTNHWARALAQWTRATARRPESAPLHFARGRAALFAGDDAAAEQALTAAADNSTDLAGGWQQVSRIYRNAGRLTEATDALAQSVAALEARRAATPNDAALRDRLVTTKTDLVVARLAQGVRLWQDTKLADAVKVWQSAEELMQSLRNDNSDDVLDIARVAQANRAVVRAFVQHGLWEDAAEQALALSDGRIDSDAGLHISSMLQLFAGDLDGYRAECRHALQLAVGSDDPIVADRVAIMCLLIPDAVDDLAAALKFADRAVTGTEEHGAYVWFQRVKGLAEYRRGNDQAVIEWLETNRKQHDEAILNATEDLLVAMAYQRLGQSALAQHWLDQAQSRIGQVPTLGLGELPAESYSMTDRMRFDIVRREAEILINGSPPEEDSARQWQRALAFARLGRIERASNELNAAGETAIIDLNGMVIRGYVLARRGDESATDVLDRAAEQLAGKAIAPDGRTVEHWMTLAEGYAALSRYDEAAQGYRNAASIQAVLVSGSEQPDANALHRLDDLYGRLAAINEEGGESEQALAASAAPHLLRTAFGIPDPLHPRPQDDAEATRADALAALNVLVEQAGPAPADAAGLRFSARLLRRRAELVDQAGAAESGANDLRQARRFLEQVLALQPDNVDCAGELAGTLRQSFAGWSVPTPESVSSEGAATLTVQSDGAILAGGRNPDFDTYTIVIDPGQPFITGIRLELLPDPSLPFGCSGRAPENGNCVLSEFEVSVVRNAGATETPVVWRSAISDHRVASSEHYAHLEMHAGNAIDGDSRTYWEPFPKAGKPHSVIFLPQDRLETPPGTKLVIHLISASRYTQHNIGRFRLAVTGSPTPEAVDEEQSASPWVRLAVAYAELGEPESAATFFAKVLDDAHDPGERLALIGQAERSAEAFAELLKLRPDEPMLYAALARRHSAAGEPESAAEARARARSLFEQQLTEQPDNEAYATMLADFLLEGSSGQWTVLRPAQATSTGGATLSVLDDGSVLASGESPERDSYELIAGMPLDRIIGMRLETVPDQSLPQNGAGRHANGNFRLIELRIFAVDDEGQRTEVEIATASSDSRNQHHILGAFDGSPTTWWAVYPDQQQPRHAQFEFRHPITRDTADRLVIELDSGSGNTETLGRFRLDVTETPISSLQLRQAIADGQLSGRGALAAARSLGAATDAALAALDEWRNSFSQGVVRIEAEDHDSIDAPWQIIEDETASGGGYAIVPNGDGTTFRPEQAQRELRYRFQIDDAGRYRVFLLCQGPTGNDDSCWVWMDEGAPLQWSAQTGDRWAWRSSAAVQPVTLAAGDHILHVGDREDGFAIDAFLLVPESTADAFAAASGWHAVLSALVQGRLDESGSVVEQAREAMRWGDVNRANWRQSSLAAVGLQALAQALDVDPDAADLYDFEGRILGLQNRQAEAIAACTQALDIDPQRIETRRERARLSVAIGDNESALADYTATIDVLRERNDIGSIDMAERLALARGDVNYALERWQAAAADFHTYLNAGFQRRAAPGSIDPDLVARMANAYEKAGQWQQAADAWTEALALKPDDQNYRRRRFDRYRYQLREYELAIADVSRLLELNPNDPWLWILRGETYRELRDWDMALSDLDQAAEVAGDNNSRSRSYEMRASVRAWQGEWTEALADLQRAVETSVPTSRAWEVAWHRALLEAWLGNEQAYREAATELDRALRGTDNANQTRLLLWTLMLDPEARDAREYERWLQLVDSTNDWWRPRLTADVRLQAGQSDETARLYDETAPGNPFQMFTAALAHHQLSDDERARQMIVEGNRWLERIQIRDPDAIVPPGVAWTDWLFYLLRKRAVENVVVAAQLAELEEALQGDPDNAGLLIAHAEINEAYGRTEEFLADLDRMPTRIDDAAALSGRAALLTRAGRLEEAHADYQQLAALEPGNAVWGERVAQLTPQTIAVWNFDQGAEGWTGGNQVSVIAAAGTLRTDSLGGDPILTRTVTSPPGWKLLTIRARSPQPFSAQLFWEIAGRVSESESHRFAVTDTGDNWQVYRIRFRASRNLTGLRLDPGEAAGQQWEIDSITLESVDEATVAGWADELIARIAQGTETDDETNELHSLLGMELGTPLVADAADWNLEPTTWRYTIYEPAQDWAASNFDDQDWSTGPAPFGSGHETQNWLLERARTRWLNGEIWLRHEFELTEIPTGPLTFRYKHDDDVEVYLNGVPALTRSGYRDYTSETCAPAAAAALRPGRNVIAVHCTSPQGGSAVDVGLYASDTNNRLLEVLTAAIARDPENRPLHRLRGDIHFDRQEWQSAIDDYNVLITTEVITTEVPDTVFITRRAAALAHLEQWDSAAAEYGTLIDRLPAGRAWNSQRSKYLLDLARQEPVYAALLRARPDDSHLRIVLGRHLALCGRWSEASEVFAPAVSPAELDTEEWFEIACLLLINDDTAGYQEFLKSITREADTSAPLAAFTLARMYGLAVQPLSDAEQAVRWAQTAVAADGRAWHLHALGLALFRAGRHEEAIKALEESNSMTWGDAGKAQNWLVLAMVHHELGDEATAREWLTRFDDWLAGVVDTANGGRINMQSIDWFAIHALRREAGAEIDPDPQSP